jgi:hypothetical protein
MAPTAKNKIAKWADVRLTIGRTDRQSAEACHARVAVQATARANRCCTRATFVFHQRLRRRRARDIDVTKRADLSECVSDSILTDVFSFATKSTAGAILLSSEGAL